MELSEFIGLRNPADYNFEFENKLLQEDKLNTYSRYFVYKASSYNARNSVYEKGKKFAEHVFERYGIITDCDGTLGINEHDTCKLAREIYRNLWGWKDSEGGLLNRYGFVAFNQFGLFGPETMNSAQRTVNTIIEEAFGKCDDENILMLKKGRFSANFMVELFSNECSNEVLIKWLNDIKGLSEFLDLYHTIGNFVLVPAYFNPYRNSEVKDYWDKSLLLMKQKNEKWLWEENEIFWNRELFVRYINYFFLWDYTDDYEPLIISNTNDFIEITNRKIRLRGKFMVAMLRINDIDAN